MLKRYILCCFYLQTYKENRSRHSIAIYLDFMKKNDLQTEQFSLTLLKIENCVLWSYHYLWEIRLFFEGGQGPGGGKISLLHLACFPMIKQFPAFTAYIFSPAFQKYLHMSIEHLLHCAICHNFGTILIDNQEYCGILL